jgi:hypothetical protein
MGEYLVSNITYPATQYEPTESPPTGAPVYHEDREVTLSATTGSQMFRTYNAQPLKIGGTGTRIALV